MARNGSYTFLVSKKEFIICCADFTETPIITGSSMRRASSSIFVTLRKPSPAPPLNTLLILQKETPSHFLVNSHNWLELQQVIQKLFSSRTLSLDLYKEALAQKLTRVPSSSPPSLDLRAGRRLVPRYYNACRQKPEDDIYWRWSPFVVDSSITTLSGHLTQI